MNRREFIMSGFAAATAGGCASDCTCGAKAAIAASCGCRPITIAKTSCGFEREPMVRPFGFKGGYLTEAWTVSAYVESSSGKHGIGLGLQSSLWSDAKVFAANSEAGGNAIMFSMTQYALKLLVGRTFTSPVELNDWLWPQVWEYGKKVSANPDLRATYALNALVAVDNAVWVLFARENVLDLRDGNLVGEERNRSTLRVMRGERWAIGARDHLVERCKAVFASEENPHGIVYRDERVQGVSRAKVGIRRHLLAVLPHLRPKPVVKLDGGGKGLADEQLKRILRHREHDRVAARLGVSREHLRVGPKAALRAEADAVLARS